ncbi:MAG: DPP IV N-terminal domain-containing protein [Longimicrobiales bacterium]
MVKRTNQGVARTIAALAMLVIPVVGHAQDRLKTYPGYDQYQKMLPQRAGLVTGTVANVRWTPDNTSFTYSMAGKNYRYDVAKKMSDTTGVPVPVAGGLGRQGGGVQSAVGGQGRPDRGRQYEIVVSPDTQLTAIYKNRNVYVKTKDGGERQITTEGNEKGRLKFGSASWVYGEELDVTNAMWWSPDSKRLAYYGMDDTPVPDYFLQLDQTQLYSKIDVEAYPKVGENNPIVNLYVHDMTTGKQTKIDVRSGQPFENNALGYYVYDVRWSQDGKEITFNRTNRRQNTLEYVACDPTSGGCRVVVHDEWLPSWIENHPTIRYLADNNRFIWESPRGEGFSNYYLYDFKTGKLINAITKMNADVVGITLIDEKANTMYYTARDGDNYMKIQLHRVSLNGKGDVRLTDPTLNHSIMLSPTGSHFLDIAQTHDTPPVVRLFDRNGKIVSEISKADASKMKAAGFSPPELFTYTSADGKTVLHGMLSKPTNFDPSRKYPVLFSVYGGPDTNGASESFAPPSALAEYGFLVVTLDTRSAAGRGKKLTDAIYLNLGVPEIDDFAAASLELAKRPYVDGKRVGIFGTSYGGYSSALALLRHPEAFAAASASSPVTSWYHYDTIYTERYMWLPQENKKGYDAGSAMTYAPNLKGDLMLYYGTADNNVHPNNMMQLIAALQKAGKHFEVQVGPDAGHSGLNGNRMMEFFIENLVLRPMTATTF